MTEILNKCKIKKAIHHSKVLAKGFIISFSLLLNGPLIASSSTDATVKRAKRLCSKKREKKASYILRKFLRKKPDNEKALLLLAKIEYNRNKLESASKHFNKLNPKDLNDESSFAYGLSFYSIGDCSKANKGFKEVSSTYALKDYARLLAATCALNKGSFHLAYNKLMKANDIPSEREKTRERLIKIAKRKRKFTKRRSFIIPVYNIPEKLSLEFASEKENTDENKSFQYTITPKLKYSISRETSDYHGLRNEEINNQLASGELAITTKHILTKNKIHLGFNLKGTRTNEHEEVKAREYRRYSADQPLEEVDADVPKYLWAATEREAGTHLFTPINDNLSFKLKFQYYDELPDKEGYDFISKTYGLNSTIAFSGLQLSLDLSKEDSYDEIIDYKESISLARIKIAKTINYIGLSLSTSYGQRDVPSGKTIIGPKSWYKFVLGGSAKLGGFKSDSKIIHTINTPDSDVKYIDTEYMSSTAVSSTLSYTFSTATSIALGGSVDIFKDYYIDGLTLDPFSDTSPQEKKGGLADGKEYVIRGSISQDLFKVVQISITASYTRYDYDVKTEEVKDSFLKFEEEKEEKQKISISIAKSF